MVIYVDSDGNACVGDYRPLLRARFEAEVKRISDQRRTPWGRVKRMAVFVSYVGCFSPVLVLVLYAIARNLGLDLELITALGRWAVDVFDYPVLVIGWLTFAFYPICRWSVGAERPSGVIEAAGGATAYDIDGGGVC